MAAGHAIAATGVDVFVPDGWPVDFTDDNRVFQSNGQNDFLFAFSDGDDPSTTAGRHDHPAPPGPAAPEYYTQLETSDVVPLEPFGSIVSLAGIEYDALWVDNQGSISIHGQIYAGVRQDGTVLGLLVEHAPAEEFERRSTSDADPRQLLHPVRRAGLTWAAGLGEPPLIDERRWRSRPRPRRGR